MKACSRPASYGSRAFSLAEVTLAMGLFVFVLVALLGMMPVALQVSRNTVDISTAAQVADGLAAQFQADFAALKEMDWSAPVYFDDQGRETTSTDGVYWARVAPRSSLSDHLMQVKITVARGENSLGRDFCYLIFASQ